MESVEYYLHQVHEGFISCDEYISVCQGHFLEPETTDKFKESIIEFTERRIKEKRMRIDQSYDVPDDHVNDSDDNINPPPTIEPSTSLGWWDW